MALTAAITQVDDGATTRYQGCMQVFHAGTSTYTDGVPIVRHMHEWEITAYPDGFEQTLIDYRPGATNGAIVDLTDGTVAGFAGLSQKAKTENFFVYCNVAGDYTVQLTITAPDRTTSTDTISFTVVAPIRTVTLDAAGGGDYTDYPALISGESLDNAGNAGLRVNVVAGEYTCPVNTPIEASDVWFVKSGAGIANFTQTSASDAFAVQAADRVTWEGLRVTPSPASGYPDGAVSQALATLNIGCVDCYFATRDGQLQNPSRQAKGTVFYKCQSEDATDIVQSDHTHYFGNANDLGAVTEDTIVAGCIAGNGNAPTRIIMDLKSIRFSVWGGLYAMSDARECIRFRSTEGAGVWLVTSPQGGMLFNETGAGQDAGREPRGQAWQSFFGQSDGESNPGISVNRLIDSWTARDGYAIRGCFSSNASGDPANDAITAAAGDDDDPTVLWANNTVFVACGDNVSNTAGYFINGPRAKDDMIGMLCQDRPGISAASEYKYGFFPTMDGTGEIRDCAFPDSSTRTPSQGGGNFYQIDGGSSNLATVNGTTGISGIVEGDYGLDETTFFSDSIPTHTAADESFYDYYGHSIGFQATVPIGAVTQDPTGEVVIPPADPTTVPRTRPVFMEGIL